MRRVAAIVAVVGALVAGAMPAGASPLQPRLLSQGDMPAGWTAGDITSRSFAEASCLHAARSVLGGRGEAVAGFDEHGLANVVELLTAAKSGKAGWRELGRNLAACHRFSLRVGAKSVPGTVRALALPRTGTASSAYTMKVTFPGTSLLPLTLVRDFVLFRSRSLDGILVYSSYGPIESTTLASLVSNAVAKAEGRPVT